MTSTPSPLSPARASGAPLPVVVAGALGRMGAEVVKAVRDAADCTLVGAIDTTPGKEGADVGLELGLGELEVAITADFEGTLCQASQAVRNAGPGGGRCWWISPTPTLSTSTPAAPSPSGCIR